MIYVILGDYTYMIGFGKTYRDALKFAYEYNEIDDIIDDMIQTVRETNPGINVNDKLAIYEDYLESDFLVSVVKMHDSALEYLEFAMDNNIDIDLDNDFEKINGIYYPLN